MAFRDDLGAAQARADALEVRVAELESENRGLREETTSPPPTLERRKRWPWLLVPAIAILGATAFGLASRLGPAVYAVAGVLALVFTVGVAVVLTVVEHASPGFALVVSGRLHVRDGVARGYRVILSGRVVCLPIVESVARLDLRPRYVERELDAWARGGERVVIRIAATMRLGSSAPVINNAIERFLGRDMADVEQVAIETLVGAARTVAAGSEKEVLRLDPERVQRSITKEAKADLEKCGIVIDTLTSSLE